MRIKKVYVVQHGDSRFYVCKQSYGKYFLGQRENAHNFRTDAAVKEFIATYKQQSWEQQRYAVDEIRKIKRPGLRIRKAYIAV